MEEEGVPVDLLGGTSMGSFVGGLYAKEPTALLTRIIARRLAVHMSSTWNQLMDLTVPVVSYFSDGRRMNKVLEPLFRGAKIEDCWLPFFCMTLDLARACPSCTGTELCGGTFERPWRSWAFSRRCATGRRASVRARTMPTRRPRDPRWTSQEAPSKPSTRPGETEAPD